MSMDKIQHGQSLRDIARQRAEVEPSLFNGRVFERVITREEMDRVDDLQEALRDLEAAIRTEEARMRREVLPMAPEGYRWASQLRAEDVPDLTTNGTKISLIFRLIKVDD